MILSIVSLFRNSLSGLMGLNFTNWSAISSSIDSKKGKNQITFEEHLALSSLLFNWADSYDSKDWERLSGILAPVLIIDYTQVSGKSYPSMAADSFVAMMSSPGFLGDPLLKTQHLLGACEWEKIDDGFVIARQQLRAGHLRFEDETHKVEKQRGHSHATNEFYFKKVWIKDLDGGQGGWEWRWAGLKPEVRWNEHDPVHKASLIILICFALATPLPGT
ncbi:hypothetical protein V493_04824 [Pseudogymnoascus sp. VKM F-4281 (FW-2241)]|nr:hypothetical protein V493_04824 [Pseudogymnoascus sp. VKM F-4281 (FW-2241)]